MALTKQRTEEIEEMEQVIVTWEEFNQLLNKNTVTNKIQWNELRRSLKLEENGKPFMLIPVKEK